MQIYAHGKSITTYGRLSILLKMDVGLDDRPYKTSLLIVSRPSSAAHCPSSNVLLHWLLFSLQYRPDVVGATTFYCIKRWRNANGSIGFDGFSAAAFTAGCQRHAWGASQHVAPLGRCWRCACDDHARRPS